MDDLRWRVQLACLLVVIAFLVYMVTYTNGNEAYRWTPLPVDRFSPVTVPAATVIPAIYEPSRVVPRAQQAPPRQQPASPVRVLSLRPLALSGPSLTGTASYYDSHCNCNAMTDQRWRGRVVHVVGPVGQADVLINDAGPVPSLHRVADLNTAVFRKVCGPTSMGLCTVTISLL